MILKSCSQPSKLSDFYHCQRLQIILAIIANDVSDLDEQLQRHKILLGTQADGAEEVAEIEKSDVYDGLSLRQSASESRNAIKAAIEQRYTLPA